MSFGIKKVGVKVPLTWEAVYTTSPVTFMDKKIEEAIVRLKNDVLYKRVEDYLSGALDPLMYDLLLAAKGLESRLRKEKEESSRLRVKIGAVEEALDGFGPEEDPEGLLKDLSDIQVQVNSLRARLNGEEDY